MIYIKRLLYKLLNKIRPRTSRTVRYAFPLAIVALAFVSAAVMTSDNLSYIKITTKNNDVVTGDLFTLDVLVGAKVPTNAIDIAVSFPKDQMKIMGIDTGESVITIWTTDPYVENNTVILRGGTFRKGFLGEHLVAQINVKALKDGVAKFSANKVTLLAGDGRGTKLSVADTGSESLTIYVGTSNETTNGSNFEMSTPGEIKANVKVEIYTDIDEDGDVDLNDIFTFMNDWRKRSARFDFNNDGKMNFVDFAILLADSFYK